MKRFLALLLIAAIIIGLVIFFANPQLLDGVWLWLIGFAGSIVGLFRNLWESFKGAFKNEETTVVNNTASTNKSDQANVILDQTEVKLKEAEIELERIRSKIEKNKQTLSNVTPFEGTTLNLIRIQYDENTTLGLLYIRDQFAAYTLEDTYRKEKIKGKTRIPSGTYEIKFREVLSGLTQKYRDKNALKEFFTWHLELQNVPNYQFVYIHIGNTHGDTDGCILIADGIYDDSLKKSILNSVKAYTRFYKRMQALLEGGERIQIKVYDENWVSQLNRKHTVNEMA